ncbi:MAG: Veg family protein [Coriobacteriia bacterium]|nr:Veg family protein [Coriobacteriia bacterium]MBS5478744.1 Veg family protein [Coriobacteriia bacterium]
MDEEEPTNKVEAIHEKLAAMAGARVRVRANMGRSRVVERDGTVLQTHDSLFILEVDERRGRKARQSYQYVDVLTGAVILSDPKTGNLLFEPEEN